MKVQVFSVYDSKAEAYLQPVFMLKENLLIRAVLEAARDPEHSFAKYPSDFTVFHLGEWEDSTATLTLLSAKRSLGTVQELMRILDKDEVGKVIRPVLEEAGYKDTVANC